MCSGPVDRGLGAEATFHFCTVLLRYFINERSKAMPSCKPGRKAGYVGGPFERLIQEFVTYLKEAGLGQSQIWKLGRVAEDVLTWLQRDGTAIESVDDAVLRRFRDEYCEEFLKGREHHRPSQIHATRFMNCARWLIRFAEHTGRTRHPGELADGLRHLDEYLAQLAAAGYRPYPLKHHRYRCHHFLAWLHQCRIPLAEVNACTLERFIDHDCVCPWSMRKVEKWKSRHAGSIKAFLRFLFTRGVMPDAFPAEDSSAEMPEFRSWLRRHRGIGDVTIGKYVRTLSFFLPDLGSDPQLYDAALIRDVMLSRFAKVAPEYAREMTKALRMYLRFLASNGACRAELVNAVPSVPQARLATLPRYIPTDDIERLIASCDLTRAVGLRDRAVLLLLARLALRAGDICALRLDDIDWTKALVKVSGKSKRTVQLPLPQDAGDAILAYIEKARPRVDEEKVFLRVPAPHVPFPSSNAVTHIVCRALDRTGMHDAHPRGAQLFRHSAATALLRSGASLETVGTLLRHRLPNTTAIYAKVNVPMLLEVAQPWVGDAR